MASLAELERENGELPETFRTRTPSGGQHIYFRLPPGVKIANRAGEFADGVDVRNTGGFVVAEGSIRGDGKAYEQIKGCPSHFADAPPWVLFLAIFNKRQRERLAQRNILGPADFGDLPVSQWASKARELLRPISKKRSPGALTDARRNALIGYVRTGVADECKTILAAPEGTRDNTLYASMTKCASLVRGAEEEGVNLAELELDVFTDIATAAEALGDKWNEDECRRKWESMTDDWLEPRDLSHVGADLKDNASATDEFADLNSSPPRTRLEHPRDVSIEAIRARQAKALVVGVIEPGDCGGAYGIPGSGKTFVGIDLGYHVSLGAQWHGRRVTRAPVLYVALEGKDGFRKRMLAASNVLGDPGDWFAHLVPHVSLDKNKAGEAGLKEIIAAAKELEAKCGEPVGLIVIDSSRVPSLATTRTAQPKSWLTSKSVRAR